MPKYAFLSDEWLDAARRIVDDRPVTVPSEARLSMNLTVTGSPRGEQQFHVGANDDGKADWGTGHVDAADLTLTTDYETARAIFVTANPQTAMQALMDGRVKLRGDLTRLMAAQAAGAGPGSPELASALAAITE